MEKIVEDADFAKIEEVYNKIKKIIKKGMIRQYEMMLCRRCFRENRVAIGFVKYRWIK